ncbi:MAG: ISL3 family transposase [Verrucomicrobiota bacterium]
MIPEKAFAGLLQLDDRWSVVAAEYETEPSERFLIVVQETERLWPSLKCPEGTCEGTSVICHDHAEPRTWRHLDAFGKRTEILCSLPRARCKGCDKVWTVPAPWEGKGKHFTKEFEAFSLTLMREMPVTRAGEILGEGNTRLWRLLRAHVRDAYAVLDFSEVVRIGVDEMNIRKGQNYLTVFADLIKRRVLFATPGRDHWCFDDFAAALGLHNGHPHAITHVAMDMSAAYRKGAEETLRNAQIVFDPFHVTALVGTAVDEVRRREAREGEDGVKTLLKGSMYLFRKNPENLTPRQAEQLDGMDLKGLAPGQAYQVRLELSDIYRTTRSAPKARYRLEAWVQWAQAKCERWAGLLAPLAKAVKTIKADLGGILAHWEGELSTAFMEGLNSVFSAVKRKARGYRNPDYIITMLYFVAGKLSLHSYPSHESSEEPIFGP